MGVPDRPAGVCMQQTLSDVAQGFAQHKTSRPFFSAQKMLDKVKKSICSNAGKLHLFCGMQ